MKKLFVFLASIGCLLLANSAHAMHITFDRGGSVGTYLDKYDQTSAMGESVVIDGPCLSACTLVTRIPRDRICVTRRARLGFHQPYMIDQETGYIQHDRGATKFLFDQYPAEIRAWIKHRGGLKRGLVYLKGSELMRMYRPCS